MLLERRFDAAAAVVVVVVGVESSFVESFSIYCLLHSDSQTMAAMLLTTMLTIC